MYNLVKYLVKYSGATLRKPISHTLVEGLVAHC